METNFNFDNNVKLNQKTESGTNNLINIAVVGCLHGNLRDVYEELASIEAKTNKKVDLLLCCGDFESIRNKEDLRFKSCPDKYKHMGQFVYYSGENSQPAPYLTIFIGGNHEASNVLNDNFYGGWVSPNIFYLGRAGVIIYKGLRIAGLSGIYKNFDYSKGHFETDLIRNIKSIYHVREYEIAKLAQMRSKIHILMTHDWPRGCVSRKDINKITKIKYHWKEELKTNTLGSPASDYLMKLLKPNYLLSGHMHFTYFNQIYHNESQVTNFIALDKAGTRNKRHYLHVFEMEGDQSLIDAFGTSETLFFDPEWLAITKEFNQYMPYEDRRYDFSSFFPGEENTKIKDLKSTSDPVDVKYSDFIEKVNHYQNNYNNMNFRPSNSQVVPSKHNTRQAIEDLMKEFPTGDKLRINFISDDTDDYSKQRLSIIKLLNIEDIHKAKGKVTKNTEEIDVNFDLDF